MPIGIASPGSSVSGAIGNGGGASGAGPASVTFHTLANPPVTPTMRAGRSAVDSSSSGSVASFVASVSWSVVSPLAVSNTSTRGTLPGTAMLVPTSSGPADGR